MTSPALRRTAASFALVGLATAGLTAVANPADAAIEYGSVGGSFYTYESEGGPSCTTPTPVSGSDNAEWVDNGVPVTKSYSSTTTYTRTDAATDKVVVQTSGTATVAAGPISGGAAPATITGSADVTASATSTLASTGCAVSGNGRRGASGSFTLTQPMWATVSGSGNGTGTGSIYIRDETSGTGIELGNRGSGSTTVLLVPGDVYVDFEVYADVYATGSREESKAYSGTFRIDLQPVGAAGAPSGKAAGYVQFGARDCATGNIAAAVTKKAKKKARSVLIKANGAKVAKLKGKKLKPKTLALPAAGGAAATVTAKVVLKNGKKATVTRSYLACS
ncbi:hypothetical protein RB608_19030 [Nocardioides sp. LHD-245]|uniref:hypothetical protein n=1 Tax=Nocardioides sp. LHD-245 TaxID=3051387 RepID=UPI0027DFBDF1|nr:hypothetical protein [Nocardioides sp. LHD-245]